MNPNEKTIQKFYTAFANANAETMWECYHPSIQFEDPAFGKLKADEVRMMWKMLLKNSNGNIKIEYSDIKANETSGSVKWIATYNFSKTNRQVVNEVRGQFHFSDGLILQHTDSFDIWKWSRQAFGFKGFLFGWTGFMQREIQKQAKISLKAFQNKDQ